MTSNDNVINGEGETQVIIKTRVRRECDNCGEPATKNITFCYINGRRNPASSMFGKDDCTYCSDHNAYACDECEKDVKRVCCPDGMNWGSTFSLSNGFEHMFLEWVERKATKKEIDAIRKARSE